MLSARREDRYPLLFVVNVGGDPMEKLPMDPTPSVRDRNVTRGAATLISRWPQHVQSTSRLAFVTTFTILCMSVFVVAVIFYTSDVRFGEGWGGRPRRRVAVCNGDKVRAYEGADVAALVQLMSPLPRAWDFLSDEDKIFFVMSEGDTLSPDKRCAVEAAARANSNTTVFLLVLVDTPQSTEVAPEDVALNGSVSVIYLDAGRYFEDTPLGALRLRGETRVLGARLVTLWRFGGLSLAVDVLSLREAKQPRHKSRNVYVDMDGHALSVRHPCHAFMFQAMKVLDKMAPAEGVNATAQGLSAGALLSAAQDLYCRRPHCRNRSSNSGKCPGFKVMPKGFVCSLQHRPANGSCVWASFTEHDVGTKDFNDVCPISSNSQPNQCRPH